MEAPDSRGRPSATFPGRCKRHRWTAPFWAWPRAGAMRLGNRCWRRSGRTLRGIGNAPPSVWLRPLPVAGTCSTTGPPTWRLPVRRLVQPPGRDPQGAGMAEVVRADSRRPVAALKARPLEQGLGPVAGVPVPRVRSASPGDGPWNGVYRRRRMPAHLSVGPRCSEAARGGQRRVTARAVTPSPGLARGATGQSAWRHRCGRASSLFARCGRIRRRRR